MTPLIPMLSASKVMYTVGPSSTSSLAANITLPIVSMALVLALVCVGILVLVFIVNKHQMGQEEIGNEVGAEMAAGTLQVQQGESFAICHTCM